MLQSSVSCLGNDSMDISQETVSKLRRHRYELIRSINPSELYPCMVQDKLLPLKRVETIRQLQSRSKEAEAILSLVEEKGEKSCKRFVRSLKKAWHHLGHAYAATLLDGTDFASIEDSNASASIRKRLKQNMQYVIDGLNTDVLVPFLSREELLTNEEMELLQQTKTSREKALTLCTILETKGPTAYYRFASCLKEEVEHPFHQELVQKLLQPSSDDDTFSDDDENDGEALQDGDDDIVTDASAVVQLGQKRRIDCKVQAVCGTVKVTKRSPPNTIAQGVLVSPTYNSKVKEIRRLHYIGKWGEAEEIVRECRLSGDIEMYVAVMLRNCSGYVTRKKKDCVKSRVREAKSLCKQMESDNRTILRSRCEWMLAKLYRYLGKMQKAQKHITKAMHMQSGVGPGEDTALGHYCQACILIRSLSENWSDETAECAKMHLRRASDHAVLGDYGLYISHHKIRLAQLCLRSSQYHPGVCTDKALIKEASQVLTMNELELEPRTRCMYYYTKSDLFRSSEMLTEAKSFITMAHDLAKEYKFKSELQAVTVRFSALKLETGSV